MQQAALGQQETREGTRCLDVRERGMLARRGAGGCHEAMLSSKPGLTTAMRQPQTQLSGAVISLWQDTWMLLWADAWSCQPSSRCDPCPGRVGAPVDLDPVPALSVPISLCHPGSLQTKSVCVRRHGGAVPSLLGTHLLTQELMQKG